MCKVCIYVYYVTSIGNTHKLGHSENIQAVTIADPGKWTVKFNLKSLMPPYWNTDATFKHFSYTTVIYSYLTLYSLACSLEWRDRIWQN